MNIKTLYCQHCKYTIGVDRVLAEIFGTEVIGIKRKHTKELTFTYTTFVKGNDFEIICGYCRTPSFVKKDVSGTYTFVQMQFGTSNGTMLMGTFLQ